MGETPRIRATSTHRNPYSLSILIWASVIMYLGLPILPVRSTDVERLGEEFCPSISKSARTLRVSSVSQRFPIVPIISKSLTKVIWSGLDSSTLANNIRLNVRWYSSSLRYQDSALSTSSVDKRPLAPRIILTKESKKESTFGIHWAAILFVTGERESSDVHSFL